MIGIYRITNIINNKCYIGKSNDINLRWQGHLKELKNNIHYNQHLQTSFNKYGEENFKFEIIEECDKSLLNERERFWITFYKSYNKQYGYNKTLGGDGGNLNITKTNEEKQRVFDKQKESRSKNYQLSQRQKRLILELKNKNLSIRKIERLINGNLYNENFISGKLISKYLKSLNITTLSPRKYIFTQQEENIIKELYLKNETIVNISKTLKISGKSIVRLLKSLNIYKK